MNAPHLQENLDPGYPTPPKLPRVPVHSGVDPSRNLIEPYRARILQTVGYSAEAGTENQVNFGVRPEPFL